MKFRLIPPGEFAMGMTQGEADMLAALAPLDSHWTTMCLSAAPQHSVRLTKAFYMGSFEVTQEQYMKAVVTNPSYYSASGDGKDQVKDLDTLQHPVETVSFNDAANFCIKLSEKEVLKPCYFIANDAITLRPGDGYRLPTEAEWEWACRAGTNTSWICGEKEDLLETAAWFISNSEERTHATGQLKSNPFGLYDAIGNVWEWCQDWHDTRAYADRAADITVDPQGPETGLTRVFRGGDWNANSIYCRSAFRDAADSGARIGPRRGFRLALSIEAASKALTEKGEN
jgi:formylglycine-generating enzyme required for sulfatase activity